MTASCRYNAQGLRVAATRMFPLSSRASNGSEPLLSLKPANAQPEVSDGAELWYRLRPLRDMVKVVVQDRRVVGAMLIGDTDLEETLENLILNGTDVSHVGLQLLDPDFDVEDYFD